MKRTPWEQHLDSTERRLYRIERLVVLLMRDRLCHKDNTLCVEFVEIQQLIKEAEEQTR